ncbi:MAG: hypothetical protein QOF81_1841 [Acidimicrobiaceae bacterium]|jgi:hypothetical protein|nr:hypothetical protein [Acidimicrobiaceae bacterium]MDQ1416228.1 hypothetical protein [Acidimicrobiaceae bacterium]
MRAVLAVVVAAVPFVVQIPSAVAGTGFGVVPNFPSNVTVGQLGLPATLQIVNISTPPENGGNITLNSIKLVPACGKTTFTAVGDCPATSADPAVFLISPTGAGESGTACAGRSLTITISNLLTGQVAFTPIGGPLVLGPPGSATAVCRIDFTFNVLKLPSKPFGRATPTAIQTAQLGSAKATSAVNGATSTSFGSSLTTVTSAQLPLLALATPTAQVGGSIADTATVAPPILPLPLPTGTITFRLFGPKNATCAGTPIFTSIKTVAGSGSYTSDAFTVTAAGTYRFTAAYSGDAVQAAAVTACADPSGKVTVTLPHGPLG